MNLDILSIFIAKVLTILGQGVSANLGCKNFRTEEVGVKLGSWDVRI
jgi:NAD-dependent SIR2 family protein deacetylase